jgi:hypothetical protein
VSSNTLYQVGNKWYYTSQVWKGTVGPFNTLLEASEALSYELENNNGKEETHWTAEEFDNDPE